LFTIGVEVIPKPTSIFLMLYKQVLRMPDNLWFALVLYYNEIKLDRPNINKKINIKYQLAFHKIEEAF
jgi:hypothetical protein